MVLQKDFTVEKFISLVEEFKRQPSKLTEYESRVGKFFKPKSAEFVAQTLIGELN
jgi:UDP-N-acetylglucosamine:LPS N-acetylglucosamine transferase